ncbi:hypothetical protein ISCGN_024583 [Ixodes scapularis]
MGSREARRVLDTLTSKHHFIYPLNEVYGSVRFHCKVQEPGESVDTFYIAVRTLVKKCHYQSAEVEDRLVRDRFVVGLLESHLSDKLCRCPKLTLEEARLQARIHEDTAKTRTAVFQDGSDSSHVVAEAKVKRGQQKNPSFKPQPCTGEESFASTSTAKSCRFFGKVNHQRSECPARQAKCRYCKRIGHSGAVCEKERGLSSVQLHSVESSCRSKFVSADVNGYAVHFKVDSGAEVTVLPSSFPGVPRQLQRLDGELAGPGSTSLQVLGTFEATLRWKDKSFVVQVYVMPAQDPPPLGFLAIQALGVVKFVDRQRVRPIYAVGKRFIQRPRRTQERISRKLEVHDGVVNMIDDILVFGSTQEEHDRRLKQLLNRLEAAGVKLNKTKCAFSAKKVKFLGVLFSSGTGLGLDPGFLDANLTGVRNWINLDGVPLVNGSTAFKDKNDKPPDEIPATVTNQLHICHSGTATSSPALSLSPRPLSPPWIFSGHGSTPRMHIVNYFLLTLQGAAVSVIITMALQVWAVLGKLLVGVHPPRMPVTLDNCPRNFTFIAANVTHAWLVQEERWRTARKQPTTVYKRRLHPALEET